MPEIEDPPILGQTGEDPTDRGYGPRPETAPEDDVVFADEDPSGTAGEGIGSHRPVRLPAADHALAGVTLGPEEHHLPAETDSVELTRRACRAIRPGGERDAVGGIEEGPIGQPLRRWVGGAVRTARKGRAGMPARRDASVAGEGLDDRRGRQPARAGLETPRVFARNGGDDHRMQFPATRPSRIESAIPWKTQRP
jgi:hypothetical protein